MLVRSNVSFHGHNSTAMQLARVLNIVQTGNS